MYKLRKLLAIDLIPAEWVARDRHGFEHFPLQQFIEFCSKDGVDIIETLVTLQRRVPENDKPEAVAQVSQQFEKKRYALEMSGGKVIECPAKRSESRSSGFKQSDDQRLMIKTLILSMKLKPDFLLLLAADGDYAPMVEALREEGVRTEVIASDDMLANDLKRCAVKVIDLDYILGSIKEEEAEPPRGNENIGNERHLQF